MTEILIILLVCLIVEVFFSIAKKCLNQNCSNCEYKNLCWKNTKDDYCKNYKCDKYKKEV